MGSRQLLVWFASVSAICVVLCGVLYVLIHAEDPFPEPPPPEKHQEIVEKFVREVSTYLGGKVSLDAGPPEWSITQQELNDDLYLMNEIAARLGYPEARPRDELSARLAEYGLGVPSVQLDDGAITLVAEILDCDELELPSFVCAKQVKLDISCEVVEAEGKLRFWLSGARLGHLPVPTGPIKEMVQQHIGQLIEQLEHEVTEAGLPLEGQALGSLVTEILKAVHGDPVESIFNWPGQEIPIRVVKLEIEDEKLTVGFAPVQ